MKKAVQIIEAHQDVFTPEWLENAEPAPTSGVGWGQLRQPDTLTRRRHTPEHPIRRKNTG